jgi:arylsulfatase A-like enzyme
MKALMRRFFVLAAVLLLVSGRQVAAKAPNIVFIFADDLTCQAISTYGDERKLLETPNIDRVAQQGMRFDRCLVTNSICGPSRATILTGKYSHKNGFYNNTNSRFDSSQTTFVKLLKDAGYATSLIGKWHLVSDPVGFDHWCILPGQGLYYNPPMIENGTQITTSGYVTDIVTDKSIAWLKNRDKSKPFLLMAQHKAPHREWAPPLRHLGWNGDRVFDEPKTLFDDYAGRSKAVSDHDMGLDRTFTPLDAKFTRPPNMTDEQKAEWDKYYAVRNTTFFEETPRGKALVKWRYQRYLHDYLACVKAVDESVGQVMAALDEEGIADDTLVVISSDQGFFLGEHGWFDKRWIFEESLRTPLVMKWPKMIQPGTSTNKIVSLLDFAQTFLDVAGIKATKEMQGHSLLPLMRGETPTDWRTSLYYHYYEFPEPHRVRPHVGVVTDRYKLVHYYGTDVDDWELLDRELDPLEIRSFYDAPDHAATVAELKKELERLRAEVDDVKPAPPKAFGNRPLKSGSPEK